MEAAEVQAEVDRRLKDIERKHDVRVLFACEAGSRAWGIESPDSDYDVRFLYVRPRAWYLSLSNGREVLDTRGKQPDPVWDVSGWDIRKALRLFRKSNPPLLEWLHSSLV